jgi:hypothetical protein
MANYNGLTETPSRTFSPPSLLHTLPPELRLEIYTHLLTTPHPFFVCTARGAQKYNIHTAILRTCKQIHNEARHVFFSRNTFAITPLPSVSPAYHRSPPNAAEKGETGDEEGGLLKFEPPLQQIDLPLLRHLSIDILYYPKTLTIGTWSDDRGWLPIAPRAQEYITSISHMLSAVDANLRTLEITADVRPYTTPVLLHEYGYVGGRGGVLDVKKYLTGFYFADQNPAFGDAIAGLRNVKDVELRFEFKESWFRFTVTRDEVTERKLVGLAGEVLTMREAFEEVDRGGDVEKAGKVVLDWPRRGNMI